MNTLLLCYHCLLLLLLLHDGPMTEPMQKRKSYEEWVEGKDNNASDDGLPTLRLSLSSRRESILQFPACLLASNSPSDNEAGSPLPTPYRIPTPPRNLARQSISVREAAKFLSKLRLNYGEDNWPTSFLLVHKEAGVDVEFIIASLWALIKWLAYDSPAGNRTIISINESLRKSVPQDLNELVFQHRLVFWSSTRPILNEVDLVVSLGGDGTVLNAAWLFQGVVPPIVPFHFGSVGFLNIYSFTLFAEKLDRMIREGCRVNIRSRLECRMARLIGADILANGDGPTGRSLRESNASGKFPVLDNSGPVFQVLNELVLDRGASAGMVVIDVFVNEQMITSVSADGLIIATPTGSTAYSMSAGGCVVHPEIGCMLITPICPHSLSFRPLILPDSVQLVLRISPHSRTSAWASFDGRERLEVFPGDAIEISGSNYPVPTVCRDDQTRDWFHGLARCLHWNDLPSSKPL